MNEFEFLLALLVAALIIGAPLAAIILSIVALVRTRKTKELARRVDELEAAMRGRTVPAPPVTREPATAEPDVPLDIVEAEEVAAPAAQAGEPPRESLGWEAFVGQKALGWIAVLLFVLAAAFFLRYAYQNNWIGPVGRVAIGALAGAVLVMMGYRYQRRGWRVLSQMFSSGGVVVLYLSTYSAFGFYHLLPYQQAGIFLAVIVIESMIVAALYDSLAIGLVAVLGGLATPLLLQSEQDAYIALFTYLAVLDLGTLVLMLTRAWPAIGTVALLGTHGLFWSWYTGNYHPEKLGWALGFQIAVYAIFLLHTVVSQWIWKRREDGDGLLRLVLNAILGFAAFYVLMKPDYGVWMGSAAMAVAIIYALLARFTLSWRSNDDRLLLSALSVAVGFVALAFPLQADANWVSFGWAATAAALWWFGQRVAAPPLRIIAAALMGLAVYRMLLFDMPHGVREPFIPVLNDFGLPAVGVVTCLLAAVIATRPFLARLSGIERFLTAAAGLVGVLLLWLVLSVECYGYFKARTRLPDVDPSHLLWLGQLSLSVLWAVFASVVLAVGFRIRLARLRWLAIAIYGVTVVKVLLIDMANLQQFYRILAFFILAIVLGLAAFAYQRLKPSEPVRSAEEN